MDFLAYLVASLTQSVREVMSWLWAHPLELVLLILIEIAWILGLLVFTRERAS